jgi:hypothetical protein
MRPRAQRPLPPNEPNLINYRPRASPLDHGWARHRNSPNQGLSGRRTHFGCAAADVGPKSAYRSRTSNNARSRYASVRWFFPRPARRFENKPAAPPCFNSVSKRSTWRRFRPSNSQTPQQANGRTPGKTSSRSNSLLLIDTTSTAQPRGPTNPGQCHVNFAEDVFFIGVSFLYCCYRRVEWQFWKIAARGVRPFVRTIFGVSY